MAKNIKSLAKINQHAAVAAHIGHNNVESGAETWSLHYTQGDWWHGA